MPMPGYIIVACSGAVDRYSNRASVFNILETVTGVEVDTNSGGDASTRQQISSAGLYIFAIASWIREESDRPDEEFESVFQCRTANDELVFLAPVGRFSFTARCHRLIINETPLPGVPSLGICTVECRIRRVGQEQWLRSQTFSFAVELANPQNALSAETAETNPD